VKAEKKNNRDSQTSTVQKCRFQLKKLTLHLLKKTEEKAETETEWHNKITLE
jgi:hypothetical protein